MARSVAFYRDLGFEVEYGGPDEPFTTVAVGGDHVNLTTAEGPPAGPWGRFIVHVDDPDAVHAALVAAGHTPEAAPADAPWGERYFHVRDPDGHEVSVARPLDD